MYRQNALLRSYALGNFGALAARSARTRRCWSTSTVPKPQRRAERELYPRADGLFTPRRGQYNEADIKGGPRLYRLERWSRDR